MRRITTRVHGIIDWALGLFVTIFPIFFIGDTGGVEQAEAIGIAPYVGQAALWTIVAGGLLILVNAIATDYEMGFRPIVPMTAHLGLDLVIGVLLIASPWIFGFAVLIAWPHVVVGAALVILALRTERETSYAY